MSNPILSHVGDDDAPAMQAVARSLAALKPRLDELCRRNETELLPPGFDTDAYGTSVGNFLRVIIPFMSTGEHNGTPCLVPVDRLISKSWRWHADSAPEAERPEKLAFLLDPKRADALDDEVAKVNWYRPLAIFEAHEGKNRVGFLRLMQAQRMPAEVASCDYPAPSRIRRFRAQIGGQPEFWAVLDDRWVQRLPNPVMSDQVLNAYGAPTTADWPPDWPAPLQVLAEFDRPELTRSEWPGRVDLDRLRARCARDRETRWASVASLPAVRLRWRHIGAQMAGAAALATIALVALPLSWGAPIGVGLGMAVVGECWALLAPWVLVEHGWERVARPSEEPKNCSLARELENEAMAKS